MMLDWFQSPERSALINAAVREVFRKREMRTAEMSGALGTRTMGDAILQAMTQVNN